MSRPSPTSSSSSSLPKITHGRSKLSAKKLWKDHSSIDIYNKGEKGRLNPPEEPPLPVSKNPKPLYRRAVTNPRPFRILHSESNYGMRNTTSLPSLYAQMTFLANAVRNNDGTTSYKGMCVKRRSQTVPSSAPGRLEARLEAAGSTDLHWTSASNDKPIPRMLLPTSPGPNSNWFAWKSPRDTDSPPESPRKERSVRTTRSESGIESRSSFLHSVAQKRGQMVVAYKHNGRQHYTLVKPPDPPPPQVIKDKHSYTTGSSVISSSYVSYTNSSKSRGSFQSEESVKEEVQMKVVNTWYLRVAWYEIHLQRLWI
ncbi:uncharacterized protein [Amphiura filiformis]|uniref:uncharacterized protein n=1 Tax=Amphiura filiformis TaxID=82378 RepID=UPI003B20D76B